MISSALLGKPYRGLVQIGQIHALLVIIPMLPIGAYMYFQNETKDYKEMGAALIALLFALQ